jgi:hypothetical protein
VDVKLLCMCQRRESVRVVVVVVRKSEEVVVVVGCSVVVCVCVFFLMVCTEPVHAVTESLGRLN